MAKKVYRLTRIWIGRDGWPCTWFRKGRVRNVVRWLLFARGRAWWYRSDDGGCYPVVWVLQPNGALMPTMDDGREAAARMGVASGPPSSGESGRS